MTQDVWLTSHPYLRPIAVLHALVEAAAAETSRSNLCAPRWDNYIDDFLAGVPLLKNSGASIDLAPVEKAVRLLVERLASERLTEKLAQEIRALNADLRCYPEESCLVVSWLLRESDFAASSPGALRYLGWTSLGRYLQPVVEAFDSWSASERWLRNYCPTCGSRPAMGQLIGADPGRKRFLSCGCCGTRWQYRRTGCPFCENHDDHRLAVLVVEGEGGLRIDYCESCNGYLKTYDGQGSESILLADWTSIHLDILARDRGLERLAGSLYEL